ncbi:MAG: ABC transporter permease [Candidatus Electrothrix sp. AS4_5]|nr:ABC transporter permease [Candidatus Electrothrix gigas]
MIEFTLSRTLIKPIFSILLAIGATIGVACLLIVLSLFANYSLSLEKVFMGIHPAIEIHRENMSLDEADQVQQKVLQNFPKKIRSTAPALYSELEVEIMETTPRKVFCAAEQNKQVCFADKKESGTPVRPEEVVTLYGFDVLKRNTLKVLLKGITVRENKTVMKLQDILTGLSSLDRLAETHNSNGAPIPKAFLLEGIAPDKVLDDYLLQTVRDNATPEHFRLIGSLDLGRKKDSHPLLVLSLENSWKLLGVPASSVNTIEISLHQPYESPAIAKQLKNILGEHYTVIDWTTREKASFLFLKISKSMAFALLCSISLVAAIGVYSTLLLAVMQNQKKIAILKALGIRNSSIYLIFISSALLIAFVGLLFGSLLGYLGSEWLIMQFTDNLKKLGLENPTTIITFHDMLMIILFTLGLFTLTALVPAKRAIAVDPVDNLQH